MKVFVGIIVAVLVVQISARYIEEKAKPGEFSIYVVDVTKAIQKSATF